MSIPTAVEKMSVEEKIQMMEFLWNDLSTRANATQSPSWHGDILRERETDLRSGSEQFEDWDTAKSKIKSEIQ